MNRCEAIQIINEYYEDFIAGAMGGDEARWADVDKSILISDALDMALDALKAEQEALG